MFTLRPAPLPFAVAAALALGAVPLLPRAAFAVDCSGLPAADLTICEDLHATSSASQVYGGQFTGSGWQLSGWGDHLHWNFSSPIGSGSATWTVDGLGWDTWIGDNCLMFQLYDTGGHWGSTYGVEFRGYGPESGGYQGNLKLKFWSPVSFDECLVVAPGGWDGSPHTFVVEWGEYARLYRDGVLLCDMYMAGANWEFWQMDMPSQEWVYGYTGPIGATLHDLTVLGWQEVLPGGPADETPDDVDQPQIGVGEGEFPAVADTTVASYLPASIFPDDEDLATESEGDGSPFEVGLVRFDLSAVDGPIASAVLQLHAADYPQAAGAGASVHAVPDDGWDGDTVTWDTRPAWDAGSLGSTGTTSQSGDYAVDVSAHVAAAVAAGDLLISFALLGGEDGSHFDTVEVAGDSGPRLVLSWTPGGFGDDDDATAPPDDDDNPADSDDDSTAPTDDDGDDDSENTNGDGDLQDPATNDWGDAGCACGSDLAQARRGGFGASTLLCALLLLASMVSRARPE
jgi:hypothetical protein